MPVVAALPATILRSAASIRYSLVHPSVISGARSWRGPGRTLRRPRPRPAWPLDTDYNNLCFHVCQAFFPRTAAWDNLKKALKADFDESVWSHLSGTKSAPFEPGENRKVAVKVIDDRGNELLVVKTI